MTVAPSRPASRAIGLVTSLASGPALEPHDLEWIAATSQGLVIGGAFRERFTGTARRPALLILDVRRQLR